MATGISFAANYVDKYISTQPGSSAFMGNRSIVVHFANGTRITCANFTIPGQYSSGANGIAAGVSSLVVVPVGGLTTSGGPAAAATTVTIITDKPAATPAYIPPPPPAGSSPAVAGIVGPAGATTVVQTTTA
ncbi:Cell surface superoxide dismutase [Cu-Zn] 4 [Teratosphaeriaceae sp. CCFEE 6253]|nr:Cell surface superoxide dismutase [Cu-Zn] 4 [Teratosphaeriaceae sp. CCFEE 6253]